MELNELKDLENLSFKYNNLYNRSGIILTYQKMENNKIKTFFILSQSLFQNNMILSDFGGLRDTKINPITNAFREFIEETTFVGTINDNPVLKGHDYIHQNNLLTNNLDKIVNKLKTKDFIVYFRTDRDISNYLYIINLDFLETIKWNNVNYNLKDIQDYHEIPISNNNYHNELTSIVIISKQEFFKRHKDNAIYQNQKVRYLIYNTLVKNIQSFNIFDNIIKKSLREAHTRQKYDEASKTYETMEWLDKPACTKTFNINTNDVNVLLNDNVSYNYDCPEKVYIDNKTQIKYITLPIGYNLYKAMKETTLTNLSIENIYAKSFTWYGDVDSSMSYIPWAKDKFSEQWKIHPYKTTVPIKLFYLLDNGNLDYLYKKILSDISMYKSKHPYSNIDQQYNQSKIISLDKDIDVLRLTTGFHITFKGQIQLLKKYNLDKSIIRRKVNIHSKFKNLQGKNSRYCFMNVCHSDLYYDLDRISPLLSIDKKLVGIICRYVNLDGYYTHTVPSLWHLGNKFHGEIALCSSKYLLDIDPTNIYNDPNNPKYKEKLEQANKKYSTKFDYSYQIFDYEYIVKNDISKIKKYMEDSFNESHFIVTFPFDTKRSNEVEKSLKGIGDLILSIDYFVDDLDKYLLEKIKLKWNISKCFTFRKISVMKSSDINL